MKLRRLLNRVDGLQFFGEAEIKVTGVTHSSRNVGEGMIFAALPGENFHGLDFLQEALEGGATAVLSDRPRPEGLGLPWLLSGNPRRHMADLAWILADEPQRKLTMIGITGTNGKSTIAHLLQNILNQSGRPAALLGTLGTTLPSGEQLPGERTTPEASELAPLCRRVVDEGGQAVVMEVSSHALEQERLHRVDFDISVFSNLSRDHLDYHGDLESYFQSKQRLFAEHSRAGARWVLPIDDSWGRRLASLDESRVISWGENTGKVHLDEIRMDLEGSHFHLFLGELSAAVDLALIGRHNLRNALAAAAAAHAMGLSSTDICRGLQSADGLPGRLELISSRPCPVFVDYAHTPDGLRAMLSSLTEITERRIIVVFGAGGDRDRGKRPLMGQAVAHSGAFAILSSDNPRSEDPAAIAADVARGLEEAGGKFEIILDRREAIARALDLAGPHSLVVVAGKGHEAEQIIGTERIPFSDRSVILEIRQGASECG